VARDTDALLRQLGRRGYQVVTNGSGHPEVWYSGTLVTTASGSRHGGRGFGNLKARIRQFEENRATRRTRRTRGGSA
jgi:hypothetical protein